MTVRKAIPFVFTLFTALFLLSVAGCLKEEYSYEGGLLPDSTIITTDTTIAADTALIFAPCVYCKYATSLSLGQWNFRYDTSFFCGDVTNAVMSPERNALTFFGPSACTPGTGLIITAYFDPVTFDGDRAGVTTKRITFQYYDNNSVKDIFGPGPATQFSITINQFEQQSGIAIGNFSGTVLTARGKPASISAGNFKIKFD